MINQPAGDLFSIIENVIAQRETDAGSNLRTAILEVFEIADQQQPGIHLATRDVYKILYKVGRVHEISSVSRMIASIEMTGQLEFVGKEKRDNMRSAHIIPVYRLVK